MAHVRRTRSSKKRRHRRSKSRRSFSLRRWLNRTSARVVLAVRLISALLILSVVWLGTAGIVPLFLGEAGQRERADITEMLYHEARAEPLLGRYAVFITTRNRRDDREYFAHANTLTKVIQDKKHGCQYSYRCDRISDRVPDNWVSRGLTVESWFYQGLDRIWLPDITGGALFYKNPDTATSDWFAGQVDTRRFKWSWWLPPILFGAHRFYRI